MNGRKYLQILQKKVAKFMQRRLEAVMEQRGYPTKYQLRMYEYEFSVLGYIFA